MNHIYRTVWNEITRSFVAAAETVRSHGKRTGSKNCNASAEHVIGAAPARRGLVTTRPNLMRLEPRLVFDGAAVDTAVVIDNHAQEPQASAAETSATAETTPAAQPTRTSDVRETAAALESAAPYTALLLTAGDPAQRNGRSEIAFVDDSVADWQSLASSMPAGVEVVKLDSRGDGLKQIADYLTSCSDVDAIHVLSHGSDGQVNLGTLTLNSSNLDAQANTLAQIGQALTADGDILLYGCEVSQTGNGQAFIGEIARLTQADVAASSDLTGNATKGGDWQLEVATGTVAEGLSIDGWEHVLTPDLTLGGVGDRGNLKVTVLADGTMVIDRFDGTNWNTQFYDNDEDQTDGLYPDGVGSGNVIEINGKVIALDGYAYQTVSTVGRPGTQVTKSGNTITVAWTIDNTITHSNAPVIASGTVVVTQRITLPANDSQSVNVEWDITNNTGTELTNVRLARVVDSYLAGGDNGTGYWDANTNTVGVTKTADGIQQKMTIKGITAPEGAESGDYESVLTNATTAGTGFSGKAANATDQDNGYGMEWVIPTLADNGTTTIKAVESFEAASVIPFNVGEDFWSIHMPASGTTSLLRFDVKNIATTDKATTLTVTTPAGWAAEIRSPNDPDVYGASQNITLQANGAFTLFVRVTIPEGVTADNYDVALNINADGDRSQASVRVSLDEPVIDLNGSEAGVNLIASLPAGSADGSTAVAFGANATYTEVDSDGAQMLAISYDPTQMVTGDRLYLGDTQLVLSNIGATTIETPDFGGVTLNGQDYTYALFEPGSLIFFPGTGGDFSRFTSEQIQSLLRNLKFDTTETSPASGTRVFNVLVAEGMGLDDASNFTSTTSPVATFTVNVGAAPIVLDLDQVGDGNANTNNSTALHDWGVPSYIADIADDGSVLGVDAPAEYSKITISFDMSNWTDQGAGSYIGVNNGPVTSVGDKNSEYDLNSPEDWGSNKWWAMDAYGSENQLRLEISGAPGGQRELTIRSENGLMTKDDVNLFLKNIFFYVDPYDGGSFTETRTFSIKATAYDEGQAPDWISVRTDTAVSTFSVGWAPDTTPPELERGDSWPYSDESIDVGAIAEDGISLYFSEDVVAFIPEDGQSSKNIYLYKVGDDEPVATFAVDDSDYVEVDGQDVYVYYDQNLEPGTQYYIKIDEGAFLDQAGNPFGGINDTETYTFTTSVPAEPFWTVAGDIANTGSPRFADLEYSGTTPYALYSSVDGDSQGLTLKKLVDGTWETVGNENFVVPSDDQFKLVFVDGNPYVFVSNSVEAKQQLFSLNESGDTWAVVGGDFGTADSSLVSWPDIEVSGSFVFASTQVYNGTDGHDIVVKMLDTTAANPEWMQWGASVPAYPANTFDLSQPGGYSLVATADKLYLVMATQDGTLFGGAAGKLKIDIKSFSNGSWTSEFPNLTEEGWAFDQVNSAQVLAAEASGNTLYVAYTRYGTNQINVASVDLTNPDSPLTVLDDDGNFNTSGFNSSGISGFTFKDFDLDIDPADGLPVVTFLYGGGGFGNFKWNGASWDMLDSNSGDSQDYYSSNFDLEFDPVTGKSVMVATNMNDDVLQFLTSSSGDEGGGDTTPPEAPTIALTTDTGSSATDKITSNGALTVSGTEEGATVEYSTDNGQTWSSSFSPVQGSNTVHVRQTDVAGNVSAASAAYTFTLDTAVPSAPTIALTTDTGSSTTDKITKDGAFTVSGSEEGATVEYSANGTTGWSTTAPIAAAGSNTVYVRQTDVAGNVSAASAAYTFTQDTAVPSAPTIALTTDSGNATDKISNSGALTLTGVEAGTTVEYSSNGTTWASSFTPAEGSNTVYVRQTDVAGNVSVASAAYTFTLDTAAPSLVSAAVNGTALVLTYNDVLDANNIPVASAFTVKVNGVAVDLATTNPVVVNATAKTVTLNLAKPVAFGKTLTVSYADPTGADDANAIQDAAGNDAAALVERTVANNSAATTNVTVNSAVQASRQVTIEVPNGLSVNDASSSASPSGLPKNVKLPLGQFGFEITGVAVGGTANLSMTLDADLKSLSYFKYNYLTGKWDNIATGSSINTATGKATVNFALTDGGAYDADRTANGVIVDPGGAGENSLLPYVLENTVEVGSVVLVNTDKVNGTIGYAITGGADQARFSIDANTGVLVFIDAPDFETPTDTGEGASNNTYVLQVTIRGSNGGSEVQNLVVTVLNVLEDGEQGGITTLATIAETAPVVIEARPEVPYVPPTPPAPPPVAVVAPPPPPTPPTAPEAPSLPPPAALTQPIDTSAPAFVAPSAPPSVPVVTARPAAESPAVPMPSSAMGLTAPDAGTFRVAVATRAPGAAEALVVNTPLTDIAIAEGSRVSVTIPAQAFAHTSADASVTLSAQRANGAALPGWMSFNPQTGTFEGTPPPGFKGEVVVRVTARDKAGREAVQVFKIAVGIGQGGVSGDRPDNTEQGQPRGSQAPGQRGAIDKLGKPSLAKQFERHGPAARHAETNELILAARKAVQALSMSGRA